MDRPEQPPVACAQHEIPPFWIATSENGIVRVDERVWTEARDLWPWFYFIVVTRLHDSDMAAQIVEDVAIDVSKRLQDSEEVGTHLRSYLTQAFIRRVNDKLQKGKRLVFWGLARNLEEFLPPTAPDWVRQLEARLIIDAIEKFLDAEAQRMLNFRRLDFSWREIAEHFAGDEMQVRQAFYYRLRKAARTLFRRGNRKGGAR